LTRSNSDITGRRSSRHGDLQTVRNLARHVSWTDGLLHVAVHRQMVNVAVPSVIGSFGVGQTQAQLLLSGFLAMNSTGLLARSEEGLRLEHKITQRHSKRVYCKHIANFVRDHMWSVDPEVMTITYTDRPFVSKMTEEGVDAYGREIILG
jgi:hypothetical protein